MNAITPAVTVLAAAPPLHAHTADVPCMIVAAARLLLETLQAESFTVTGTQVVHVHPGTGAETRLLTIARRERNRPVLLAEALARLDDPRARLLVNERSGRAAVRVPAPGVMLDDGSIEARVRLIRPMETRGCAERWPAEAQWAETSPEAFAAAWTTEVAGVPEFAESTIHVVTGLLLPIWKRLTAEAPRVYRLQTDAGERIVGWRVSPAWAATALTGEGGSALAADDAHAALLEGRTVIDLDDGLQLRRMRVMGVHRIELLGFSEPMRERLRSFGLFSEIVAWRLRFFVPVEAAGTAVLGRLLDRHAIVRVIDRDAA